MVDFFHWVFSRLPLASNFVLPFRPPLPHLVERPDANLSTDQWEHSHTVGYKSGSVLFRDLPGGEVHLGRR